MQRVVSLFLPSWPIDRLRRHLGAAAPPPEVPLVLAGRDARRRVVWAANPLATAQGLHPGLPLSQAQALVPGLVIHEAEPEADNAALAQLALWALRRYAPVVAPDPPDGLAIDITGVAHLFRGEAAMLRDLVQRLAAAGVAARAVVSATYGASHALARRHAEAVLVVSSDRTAAALVDLPVSSLRLLPDQVASLRRLGFERIGDLEAQPRAPLALRFGPMPGRRLDQAFGRLREPIVPVVAPEMIQAERIFAEPIGAPETIARYIGQLAEALSQRLEQAGLGTRRLDLLCHRVDNQIEAIRAGMAKPVRDAARLTRLLCDRMDTLDPGFGIERMILASIVSEPLVYRGQVSELGAKAAPDVSELIDTLANRVGANRLYRMRAVESDVPERSWQRVPPMAAPSRARWPAHWPRPTRLLRRPEPIDTVALLPDHPPSHFTWRHVRHRVRSADGPERIFGEWHRRAGELTAVRDYFQLEDADGARFWVFRSGDGEDAGTGSQAWFMHGLFA